MKKIIESLVTSYLRHDEGRARRIIKAAWPKLHVAERPRKKKEAVSENPGNMQHVQEA